MLNSATAPVFPSPSEPPMKTIWVCATAKSGKTLSMRAALVIAPVHTSTAPPLTASAMHTTAGEWVCAPRLLSGRECAPGSVSRPESPWIPGHATAALTSGFGAPGTTGTLAAPQACSTRSALAVVLGSDWLPCTVDTPSSRRWSGLWQARMMASASSCPGSQSSHTSCGGIAPCGG